MFSDPSLPHRPKVQRYINIAVLNTLLKKLRIDKGISRRIIVLSLFIGSLHEMAFYEGSPPTCHPFCMLSFYTSFTKSSKIVSETKFAFTIYGSSSRLGSVVVSASVTGPKVCGFETGQGDGF
jgi:hypothetical protein